MKVLELLLAACICVLPAAARAEPPQPFGKGSLQAILKSHRPEHADDRAFLGPDVRSLPGRHAGMGGASSRRIRRAAFVTVDTDEVPDPRDAADRLWQAAGVTRRIAWRFDDAVPEQLFFDVDRSWQGRSAYDATRRPRRPYRHLHRRARSRARRTLARGSGLGSNAGIRSRTHEAYGANFAQANLLTD